MSLTAADASPCSWAEHTFGQADFGDLRRTRRLVEIAAQMATAPSGRVTSLFTRSKEREGAYRFLESPTVSTRSLLKASALSTLQAHKDEPYLFVPIDGSSLNLADPSCSRELGPLGSGKTKARGLQVMNAIAVSPAGTTVGLLDQYYWARPIVERATQQSARRTFLEKESRYWARLMLVCCQTRDEVKGPRLWFQLDRGGDIGELYWLFEKSRDLFTARAAHDRRLWGEHDGKLRETLRKQPVLGTMDVILPGKAGRPRRQVLLELRAVRAQLRVKHPLTGKMVSVELSAVRVRERQPPRGQEPIEWILWTNHEVKTFEDACEVARGYCLRWRVEEFHRTWKSNCEVEKTLLVRQESVTMWAAIGAAVATRIERLKRMAREEPDVPATMALSRHEIDAIILLRQPKGVQKGDTPTLGQCVEWVAEIGGYTGRTNSRHPPGSTTIARGLEKISGAAAILERLSEM